MNWVTFNYACVYVAYVFVTLSILQFRVTEKGSDNFEHSVVNVTVVFLSAISTVMLELSLALKTALHVQLLLSLMSLYPVCGRHVILKVSVALLLLLPAIKRPTSFC